MDGSECRSAETPLWPKLVSTMAAPPARLTSALLATRSLTPRSQTTTLPAALAGSSVPAKQRRASSAVAAASFTAAAVTSAV